MGIEELLLDMAEKKGRKEAAIEIAAKMKKCGLDINLISKITGLSTGVIENLQ